MLGAMEGARPEPLDEEQRSALRLRCRRLAGHPPRRPGETLAQLADWCEERELLWDHYGQGVVLQALEEELAGRFGKPAAVFLPTGTMAQQIAMRLWAERKGTRRVAVPPHSHLELHEHDAHRELSGLEPVPLGDFERVVVADDLAALADPLAAALVELPAREIGGKLPTRDELAALVAHARERGIALHLDGARSFEAAAGYGCTLAELASSFDSVYVSLYKGIGGLAGAVLLGESDWIEEAARWKRRYGGTAITLLPFAASAHMLLDQRIERMDSYVERARELARRFGSIEGVRVDPPAPHVNMMHLVVDVPRDAVLRARDTVAERRGLWVLNDPGQPVPGDPEGSSRIELTVGDATLAIDPDEAEAALRELVALAVD